jgi:hypothetical protein
MAEPLHAPGVESTGYEKKDINVKMIIVVAAAIVVLIIVLIVWIDSLYQITREQTIQTSVLQPQSASLRELRAHEDEVLNSYKLLDSAAGKYQIPIDRAIELMAEEAYQSRAVK